MKTKLRILHIIGGGEFGGAEQHILHLLTSFPHDEVEATVVCFYDSVFARKLREAHIPVIPMTQYGRFDIRVLRGLRQLMKQFQPDVVHSHGIKANFLTRLAAYGLHPFVVTTIHSNLRYDYENPLVYTIVSLMEKSTRSFNQHTIVVSDALKQILSNDGVAPQSISTIYNGIDLTPFRKQDEREADRLRLLTEWGIPADTFVMGSVARLVAVKGHTYLLEGFARFLDRVEAKNYRLVLVGDGPERAHLESYAVKLGIEKFVHFAGFRQDIPQCLHAFDLFVHTSLYEGLGFTILEAMASEVPVIATIAGGVKEIVFHEKTGIVIEQQNAESTALAMLRMVEQPDLREKLVREARQLVESTFTIEQMAVKTLTLYRQHTQKKV
ncbi:glycosyltransferase [Brevibacillus sp. SYSU BS000544]|uniref:glycosyltransferase n=1 Tax=Brevibacillus sp. SYSU BS000544 TaxID=3416443 RepID=UPI003CE5B40F